MAALSADKIFKLMYPDNSTNFLTPHVIRRCKAGKNRAIELSYGYGMQLAGFCSLQMKQGIIAENRIFGVTVLDYDDATHTVKTNQGLRKLFNSEEYAESYILRLQGKE